MSESVRQRKRPDESNTQSAKDDIDRNITIDRDDRRSRTRASLPLS
jgi:hypothetical protein